MARLKGSKNKPRIVVDTDVNIPSESDDVIITPIKHRPLEFKSVRVSKKSSKAEQLVEALAFISVAGTKDDQPYKQHVIFANGYAIASDGVLTAGFPIIEDIRSAPNLQLTMKALKACKDSLSISANETLFAINGSSFEAGIPCIPFNAIPDLRSGEDNTNEEGPYSIVTGNELKKAFEICGSLVSENGRNAIESAIPLEPNVCTSLFKKQVMMQYWHGINMPQSFLLPKIFTAAVCKIKTKIVAFSFVKNHTFTLHFEDKSWLRTNVYEDKYPNTSSLLDRPSSALTVQEGFFEAIETVAEWNDDKIAYLTPGRISSRLEKDTASASFEIDIDCNLCFSSEHTKLIAPYVKTIDLKSYDDRAFFFGDQMRGVIISKIG